MRKRDFPKAVPALALILAFTPGVLAQDPAAAVARSGGQFELSAHVSSWSVDFFRGLFETSLADELGEEIRNEIAKSLSRSYGGLVASTYAQDLAFDSKGSNYGLELRYYTRGWAGTFSLGLALEKTNIELSLAGTARQDFTNGSTAQAGASAIVRAEPLSTHLSFRWEIGNALSRVKPFITLGFGLAPLKGTFRYEYEGSYAFGSVQETIGDAETRSFTELSEDLDFEIPDFLVFFQLHFGLKVEVYRGLSVLGEAGLWNGFLLRGGIAYRF